MPFARKNPELVATVFDLPGVIPLAKKYVAETEVKERVKYIAGDMRTDPFGENYDLVLLAAICHMWGPKQNQELFAKCGKALKKDGRIVVVDFILNESRTAPTQAAMFAINMLVSTREGNTYAAGEYIAWLERSGFTGAKAVEVEGAADMIVARKR